MNWLRKKNRAKYTNLRFTGMLLHTSKTNWTNLGPERGCLKDVAFSTFLRLKNEKKKNSTDNEMCKLFIFIFKKTTLSLAQLLQMP